MNPPMPSVERTHLREQILSQALPLFIEHGYVGLSMREIAQAVGVSKPALYYHFKDKESLFLAVLDHYLEDVEEALEAIAAQETHSRERLHRLVGYFLSQPLEQRALIRMGSQEMANLGTSARQEFKRAYEQKFLAKVRGMIQSGIDRGELKPVDPGLATWVLLGMLLPFLYPAYAGELPSTGEAIDGILGLYLEGMAVRP